MENTKRMQHEKATNNQYHTHIPGEEKKASIARESEESKAHHRKKEKENFRVFRNVAASGLCFER